ncbi:MAG: ankyrin repeat domain-containing protein [Rhodocyclaceae bacterium]|nr:ankyrin repeat domain-containing protein [Rhodocyclaceae bacterium]
MKMKTTTCRLSWLARKLLPGMIGAVLASAMPAFGEAPQSAGAHARSLHDAAQLGTGNDVTRILTTAPGERDARDGRGTQAIHLAAGNSDSGPLRALIAAGANPNARDSDGVTPLHLAVLARNAENTRLLLAAGADPAAKNNAGRDALAIAHEVLADKAAGVIALWILKGCQPKRPC